MTKFLRFQTCLIALAMSVPLAGIAQENAPKKLTVSAAPATEFSFDVRLFPDATKRKKGNAAIVFLRHNWELVSTFYADVGKMRQEKRLAIPIDKFSRASAPPIRYDLLKQAAMMSHADWERNIRNNNRTEDVLLPDVQQARSVIYALALNIRADIAENKIDRAIEKLKIGFALVHHLQQTPFYVVKLVAKVNANVLLDQVESLITRPDCPNLYWALNQLPSPLINVSECIDFENAILSELRDTKKSRTESEWEELGQRIKTIFGPGPYERSAAKDDAFKKQISSARSGLVDFKLFSESQVDAMSDNEVAVRWFAMSYIKWTDGYNRWINSPPTIGLPQLTQLDKVIDAQKKKYPGLGHGVISFRKLYVGFWETQRRIEALKTVEAIRASYASAEPGQSFKHGDMLGQQKTFSQTPLTLDPFTGKPFNVKVEESNVVIKSIDHNPSAGKTIELFRLTIRKR